MTPLHAARSALLRVLTDRLAARRREFERRAAADAERHRFQARASAWFRDTLRTSRKRDQRGAVPYEDIARFVWLRWEKPERARRLRREARLRRIRATRLADWALMRAKFDLIGGGLRVEELAAALGWTEDKTSKALRTARREGNVVDLGERGWFVVAGA